MKEFAIPIEFRPALQQERPDAKPFQPVLVAAVLIDGDAVQVELLLVPAADNVEAGSAVRDMIDGGDRLGAERRRNQRYVHGGEDRDALRQRTEGGAMRECLERTAIDVGLALEAAPL